MSDNEEFEKLSSFIGRYILFFQYVESKVDQMLLLATDLNRWHVGQTLLTKLGYRQKVDVLSAIVHSSQIAHGSAEQQEWIPKCDSIVTRLQAEGTRRNDIVHSLHMFDFVKIGAPLSEVGQAPIKMDANFAHVQLVAWYDDLGHQSGMSKRREPDSNQPGYDGSESS